MVPVGELNATSSRGAPQLTGENASSWTGLGSKGRVHGAGHFFTGFLFGRFDGMIFGPGPPHPCMPHMKAVLRQVTNEDILYNLMTRQAAYVVASQIIYCN